MRIMVDLNRCQGARAPHPLYDYQFLSMEHWDNAVLGAPVAAHNVVSLEADRWPHLLLPHFWSGQFGVNIKSVGVCSFGEPLHPHLVTLIEDYRARHVPVDHPLLLPRETRTVARWTGTPSPG